MQNNFQTRSGKVVTVDSNKLEVELKICICILKVFIRTENCSYVKMQNV